MKNLFLIASIMVILSGAAVAAFDMATDSSGGIATIIGFVIVFLGVILLITGLIWSSATKTKEVKYLSYLLIAGCITVVIGLASIDVIVGLVGAVMILIGFLIWPCLCCKGQQSSGPQVIGVATAHTSITITEISEITGMSPVAVRKILYDAIGKRKLIGRMEGETFIRSAPEARPFITTTPSTTREREIVTVLVICPYCGAKTEQGRTKCTNCEADL